MELPHITGEHEQAQLERIRYHAPLVLVVHHRPDVQHPVRSTDGDALQMHSECTWLAGISCFSPPVNVVEASVRLTLGLVEDLREALEIRT